ncbi:hypothetical protein [Amycolatopsis sp. SID8362]|uniref:hypothetical protein n=1 Tax=Amycolatopsis sp. SID8362 TaxID=2690346 RepID=UPI001369A7B3|nr:hypothetical protein [Amycolatopsis sp. SID8362]NBH02585.1 hypothetical protein [Amycolatopsis sp. SID8362]NED39287.1 hypothetical protein [Amycolatopsis sp. SID8362]
MLELQYSRGVVVVRVRPAPSGSLNRELLDRLGAALAYIGPDRAIVLTGTGDVFAPDLPAADGLARTTALSRLREVRSAVNFQRRQRITAGRTGMRIDGEIGEGAAQSATRRGSSVGPTPGSAVVT